MGRSGIGMARQIRHCRGVETDTCTIVLGALCHTAGEKGDGEEEVSLPLDFQRLLLGIIPLRVAMTKSRCSK